MTSLENAWEMLGGLPCNGFCGYVEDMVAFEMNKDYSLIIEKKAENLYRTISQKQKGLPTSNQAVKQSVLRTQDVYKRQGAAIAVHVPADIIAAANIALPNTFLFSII